MITTVQRKEIRRKTHYTFRVYQEDPASEITLWSVLEREDRPDRPTQWVVSTWASNGATGGSTVFSNEDDATRYFDALHPTE